MGILFWGRGRMRDFIYLFFWEGGLSSDILIGDGIYSRQRWEFFNYPDLWKHFQSPSLETFPLTSKTSKAKCPKNNVPEEYWSRLVPNFFNWNNNRLIKSENIRFSDLFFNISSLILVWTVNLSQWLNI